MLNNIRFKKAREQSGQSTVEYIVLVTAVLGVIILFMTGNNNVFQNKLNTTLETSANGISDKSTQLRESHNTNAIVNETSKITFDVTKNIY